MATSVNGFTIFGAIEQKWLGLGRGGFLGPPVGNGGPTIDRLGRALPFLGGTISWHPTIGAFEVHGLIGAHWRALGREQFGNPITDESVTPDQVGRFVEQSPCEFCM
jgi:uncharacterized protein with LGFP repeats